MGGFDRSPRIPDPLLELLRRLGPQRVRTKNNGFVFRAQNVIQL